jgi:phosphoglucosamine mutase
MFVKIEKKYFGTDGIRGVAGEEPLDSETMVRLGKAIAKVFLNKKGIHRILIGKDTRLSGYMIETAIASGVMAMGADVLFVGPLPTPGVAYLTKSMRADAGIMISASHNPFEDNGIKIFAGDGFKLPDETELVIENLLDNPNQLISTTSPSCIGRASRVEDAIGRYTVYLKGTFPNELSLEGLKIGFDAANGSGYVVGPQVYTELGGEVITRGVNPNGRNINSGFGSLYPEMVGKLVKEQNLHLGITLDGDADRVVFVDEKGGILDGDMILAICAIDLKERGLLKRNTVVSTLMSNIGLKRYLTKHDISLIETQVGDRYVNEAMRSLGCQLGGEQSGHTIFSDLSTGGDGILTSLQVLSAMLRKEKPLSEMLVGYTRFPQKLINVAVVQKPPLESIESIAKIIKDKEQILGDSGRVFVRYSGTENKVRVMVECEDEAQCRQHAADVADVLERELGAA